MGFSTTLLALTIAALAGVTMALQGSLNSALGKIVGLLEATFIVHVTGLILVSILLFAFQLGNGQLVKAHAAPWYTLLGGILNVAILYGVVSSIPRVGVAPATTAIIAGQVLTATVVDNFGLFGLTEIPFNWWRLIGVALLAGGAWCLLHR